VSAPKKRYRKASVWLAFVAVLVQVLIPNIVAAEITLATSFGLEVGLLSCPFGHLHAAALPAPAVHTHDGRADGGAPLPTDRSPDNGGLADGCSICIALHTGGQFMAPAEIQVAMPLAQPRVLRETMRSDGYSALVASAAYHARAPPMMG
jgi:hypothetical protein